MVKLREIKTGGTFVFYASCLESPKIIKILDTKSIKGHTQIGVVDTDIQEYTQTKTLRHHIYDIDLVNNVWATYYKAALNVNELKESDYESYNDFVDAWPEKLL